MLQIRSLPRWPRLAAAFAVVFGAAVRPAAAQIVRTFDQSRSTSAHANAASRDNSIVGFGTWSSALVVDAPGGTSGVGGVATQSSGIYGDSTVAQGESGGHAAGAPGSGAGISDFRVYFLLEVRMGYTLVGDVAAHAAGDGGEGEASAMIQFSGAGGTLAAVQTDCSVDATQTEPCEKSDHVLASGILEPGTYLLEAHASSAATGSGDTASGTAGATFSLRIWFDGPIVGTAPTSWSQVKNLYR